MATVRIPLHSRKYPGLYALVDEADADMANRLRWYPSVSSRNGRVLVYASSWTGERNILLHRFIISAGPKDIIDHINGDTLDCRRSNIRVSNHSLNAVNSIISSRNTSGFRGVYRHSAGGWVAQIQVEQQYHYLGYFKNAEEAAIAYDQSALKFFGERAFLNFYRAGHRQNTFPGHILPTNGTEHYQRGQLNNSAKLTDEQVIEAFDSVNKKRETQSSVARRLGVSQSLISLIASGKRWSHLTGSRKDEKE